MSKIQTVDQNIANGLQNLRNEQRLMANKLSELNMDLNEHKYVKSFLILYQNKPGMCHSSLCISLYSPGEKHYISNNKIFTCSSKKYFLRTVRAIYF